MPRGLTTSIKNSLGASKVEFYHLVRMDFTTPLYYTNAPYNITYGGNEYVSTSITSKIPDFKETMQIKPNSFSLKVSGVSLAMQAISLSADYMNTEVYIYRYVIASSDAFLVNKGFIDGYKAVEDPDKNTSVIEFQVANHWSNWEQESQFILTDERQQDRFTGDLGLEYIGKTDWFIEYWGNKYGYELTEFGLLDAYVAMLEGRLQTTIFGVDQGSSNIGRSLPVVYGETIVEGIPVFRVTSGADSEYLHVVYAIAAGECESLEDIILESDLSYLDSTYSGLVTTEFYSGTDTQTASAALIAASSGLWTSAHRLRGICYVYARFTYNADVFSGDPSPKFKIRGKKIYDPRTTTTVYSKNTALVLADYMTSTTYGKGLSYSEIDGLSDAADYCDQLKTDHTGGTATNIRRMEYSGVVSTGEIKKNVENIASAMLGAVVWSSGQYSIVITRDDDTSSYSFDDSNMESELSVSEKGSSVRLNSIYCDFNDERDVFRKNTVESTSATYLALDNGKPSSKKVTLKGETNVYRAQNRANTLLKLSRENIEIEFNASNADAIENIAGDVIDVTNESKGWVGKLFRITELGVNADGGVSVTATEYNASSFNWFVSVEKALPSDTNLPNPFVIAAPTALVMNSGTANLMLNADGSVISRINVSFTPAADAYVVGYEAQYKKSTESEYGSVIRLPSVTDTEFFITPVNDGAVYDVRVRALNSLGRPSAWLSGTHTVIGKTEPPSDVASLNVFQNGITVVFKWAAVTDLDLQGYEIRYGVNGSSTWEDAQTLTRATRGTNVTTSDVPPGEHTFLIKAIDTSGNYSVNATTKVLTITAEQDIIYQYPAAPDWTGATLTNLILHHTGVLVPDSQNLASDDGWETFDEFVVNPYVECTVETPEADIDFDDLVRVWGESSLVLGPGETGSAEYNMQIDHKLSAGTYDGFEDWSVGQITLRYMKAKLIVNTENGVPYIANFTPTIDVLEHTLRDDNVAIAAGGSTITFDTPFHNPPFVRVFINGDTALYPVRSNVTTTGFDCNVFNSSSDVGGTIDYEAIGS